MDTNLAAPTDHRISTEVQQEKIVSCDTIELIDVSLETKALYHCEKCGKHFTDSNVLSSHLCLASPSTSFAPRILTSKEETVKPHLGLYKCPLCHETFSLPRTLKRHFRNHAVEPEGAVSCSEPGCQFTGADRREYQVHLRTVHSLKLITCTFHSCRVAFLTVEEMEKHRRNHLPFHCNWCDFTTANAKQFGKHCWKSHHLGTGNGGKKDDEAEKMESQSGTKLCGSEHFVPERPQTSSTSTEAQEEEEGSVQNGNIRTRDESDTERLTATTGSKDHHSKCHVSEGSEHLFRTHMCPECRRCFKKRTHLREHLRLHFPDPRLQCPTCLHHFTSRSKLRVHLLREAGSKPHGCPLCEYRAVEPNSLRRHLASVHGEERTQDGTVGYACPTCGQTFRLSGALKTHMKSHHAALDGLPLRCFQEDCVFQSVDRKELQRHAADVHGVRLVECRHHACRALFKSQEDMEEHHRTHLAFHCTQCDFSCSNKSRFQRHLRQGHPGTDELRCTFCTFTTFNPVEFEGHVGRLHANEKTHHCLQCGFVTAYKRVLARHMLLHSGEKPHKCKVCDFRCRDETYLSKHMLTHSDDKNHMCSECGYVTKWKHYLNVHMRKHAGDLRYQCSQCSYRCHRADQLSSHKLRHQEKSLMCEVCAFSCKRKYELRKHMQLKHAWDGENPPPPPLFQCKYCAYSTRYRQALLNHENCKHTRQREYRCALCAYTTFSSTSLFLHKRKAHGYVPGDQEWLERYAQKERESSISAPHGFCQELAPPVERKGGLTGARTDSTGGDLHQAAGVSGTMGGQERDSVAAGFSPTTGQETVVPDMLENGVTVSQELSAAEVPANTDPVDEQDEECSMPVLNPLLSNEHVDTTCTAGAPENVGEASLEKPLSDSRSLPGSREESSQRETGMEEDDASMADCEEGSDEGGCFDPSGPESRAGAQGVQDMAGGLEEVGTPSGCPEASTAAGSLGSEAGLKALQRRDREQAEALVLEGRVQMLVVQNKGSVFHCDRCSYVTCRQRSLRLHQRSACAASRAAMQCQDCGAQFKQQRGLQTHRLRKCPVLQKKDGRCPRQNAIMSQTVTPTPAQNRIGLLGEASSENNQSESVPHGNHTSEVVATPPQPGRGKEAPSCSTEFNTPSQVEYGATALLGKEVPTTDRAHSGNPQRGDPSMLEGELRYREEDGRFKCNKCSFTSCRLSTIERHYKACSGKDLKQKAVKSPKQNKLTSTQSEEDEDGAEERGDIEEKEDVFEGKEKSSKLAARLACPNCPFMCHQQRALDRHQLRGCLRHDDLQCQRCSFVAKSQEALQRHAQVHGDRKPTSGVRGKKSLLQCELCSFSCKQRRRLEQHVALQHRGEKPHACRFCGFSTTRRYRLEAHESLHTGQGRHACPQCSRTFGTTSKLRLHRQRVHERRPTHFCSSCDYSGYSISDISRHTQSCHTGELLHACLLCPARFSSDFALKQHGLRRHQEPVSLACPSCDFSCHSQASLKAHSLREHPRLHCLTCGDSFPSRSALEEHRQTHFTQRCPECPFAARERQSLVQHLLDEHEQGPPEEQPLACGACDFRCRHRLVLDQHVRSHGGARLYKCTDCQYSTRNRQKITWHIRIHTGEKPYRCEQCSYACTEPSRLKYHMRIHQDERKYLCPECGYKCKWVNQLKYHMTKHTGVKPYACQECDYRTNRADVLRIHRETRHSEARSFICEECGKGFKTRFLLNTHQRKHSEARPYVCRICRRDFRWPAGLRHHYLTHIQKQPFHCRHCAYSAKHRFQVLKHLRRHHPELPVEQGVGRDPGPHTIALQVARLVPGEDQRPIEQGPIDQGPEDVEPREIGQRVELDACETNQGEGD
ncbi:hypothetical protein GJAV_G00208930 [Gymnothorax javanicus]|nr:hypothetical protein GJAV_G00208930 [Gymnothorax javanicus]